MTWMYIKWLPLAKSFLFCSRLSLKDSMWDKHWHLMLEVKAKWSYKVSCDNSLRRLLGMWLMVFWRHFTQIQLFCMQYFQSFYA